MNRSEEIARRVEGLRVRNRRRELAGALEGLLGAGAPVPLDDAGEVERLVAAIHDGYAAALAREEIVSRSWRAEEAGVLREAFARLARRLGGRAVWGLDLGWMPLAFAVGSDSVLSDPLGFAAATGHHLAILDVREPAGLSLARHSHHFGPRIVRFTWELECWGEPWRAAVVEALGGSG